MRRPPPRRRSCRLDDRVVLITGAGRGLGAATAHELARRAARVVIADRDLPAARAVAAALPHGRGHAVECDVTDPESVRAAAGATRDRFDRIDVVVANAGILGGGATLRSMQPGQAERVLEVNVAGVLNTVAATIDDVITNRGQIVLISSVFAYINGAGAIPYAMSKAAIEQLGRGLGVELAAHGASVLTAYFALLDTDMIRDSVDADPHLNALLSASPRFMLKRIPPGRAATAIADGIQARRQALTVPARWRPVSALRGIVAPALDARYLQDTSIQRALTDLENHRFDVPAGRP